MRLFYILWFFFSAGWDYLMAGFPEGPALSVGQLLAVFPVASLTFAVLLGLQLRQLGPGKLAEPPCFDLRPWNQPTGLMFFIAITFLFASIWGVAIAIAFPFPGLRVALSFSAMGAGALAAIHACRYAFPSRFRS